MADLAAGALPPARLLRILTLIGAVLLVATGLAATVRWATTTDGVDLAEAVFFLGMGVPATVIWARGGPLIAQDRPVTLERHAGKSVTVLPARATHRSWSTLTIVTVTAYGLLAAGRSLGGWADSRGWPLYLLAVAILAGVLLDVGGRIGSGDLWLTPEGVGQHFGGREQWMPWSAIVTVDADPADDTQIIVRGRPGTRARHHRTAPTLPVGLRRPAPATIRVDARRLGAETTLTVVAVYARRADLRERLGTPASLADLEQLVAG